MPSVLRVRLFERLSVARSLRGAKPRARALALGVALLSSLASAGCGGDDTECPPGTRPVGEGCVEIPDATVVDDGDVGDADADGGRDADVTCVPSEEPDELDRDGRDTDCDGVDGVASELIFVSSVVGNDSNAGTPDAPLATLTRAIELAGARVVVADEGPFAESLVLTGSARVHGGYAVVDGRWVRGSTRTRVMSASTRWTLAEGDTGRLVDVDVEGAAAPMGESAYGMRVEGPGDLSLTRVSIRAGDGGAGADGSPGEPGAAGDPGTDGRDCHPSLGCSARVPPTAFASMTRCSPRGGSGGGTEQPGTAGERLRDVPGGGAGGGGGPTTSPTAGSPGDPGPRGTDGVAGVAGSFERGGFSAVVAGDGTDGTAGEGGGGGGGGWVTSMSCTAEVGVVGYGASGGSGGGGGCGGTLGRGGVGGGASVALWVEDARVVFEDVTLATGDGGFGGAGGSGGAESLGGAPGMGGASRCSQTGQRTQMGAPGGRGGAGGRGGHGGGGAGGPSVGLVLLGGEVSGAPVFELGTGGFGGSSEGNRGPRGERVERVER